MWEAVRNRAGYLSAGLLLAVTTSGCPMGAELENPERFVPFTGGVGTTGGSVAAGMGGSPGGAGAGGATFSCNVDDALLRSCGRNACHNAGSQWADLILTDAATAAIELLDVPATHGDIQCSVPPEPYRACTPAELPATCPQNVMLIDSMDIDSSWVLRKLDPAFVQGSCGDAMPAPPGNSTSVQVGWSEERRACLIEFFRSLAAPP